MATLKDIADICGVSTATVSYVLSGRGTEKRITEQTQQELSLIHISEPTRPY